MSKWVNRYKSLGIKGLFDKARSGRRSKLSSLEKGALIARIQSGPTEKDQGSVFRGLSIKGCVEAMFKVEYSLSGIYALLKRLNFKRIKPRPRHEKNDKALMQQWKEKTLPEKIKKTCSEFPSKSIEIWYQDEMRYGQKTRMTYEWKLSGTSYQQIKQLGFENKYIFGAVHPESGRHIGLVFSECTTDVMNVHLGLISKEVGESSHAILIMDCAGWHSKSRGLIIPNNISILDLPPYSPELNPVERLWKWLKENFLSNRVIEKNEDLVKIGCELWKRLTNERVKSICRVS